MATLATLIYLARQIRQNTSSVRSANFGIWIEAINRENDTLVEIADFAGDALAKREFSSEVTEPGEWSRQTLVNNRHSGNFAPFTVDGDVNESVLWSRRCA